MGKTITSKLAFKLLDFTKSKLTLKTDEEINNYLKEKEAKNKEEYKLPLIVENMYEEYFLDGMKYYLINKKANPKKVILYLHGGSYIDQPLPFHWLFLNKIAKKTKALIYVPIYPKIPISNYREAYTKVLKLYKEIIKDKDLSNLTIMGDSAGGGLALGLAQELVANKINLPNNLILISPWINLELTNPYIKYIEEFDPMLSLKQLQVFGKLWARKTELNNPLVSPLYGDLNSLPPITYFTGVNEILYPDALIFKEKAMKANISLRFIEDKNMYHCYPLFPIKNGKKAVNQIVRIINKKNK